MLFTTTLLAALPAPALPPFAATSSFQRVSLAGSVEARGLDPALRDLVRQVRALGLAGPSFGVLPVDATPPTVHLAGTGTCEVTAALAARATMREAQEDLLLAIANCLNTTDPLDLAACLEGLWGDFSDDLSEARQVYDARLEVCALTGEDLYDPPIDPDDFLDPQDYAKGGGNEFFPLVVGTTWVYEKEEDGEIERVTVSVEEGTRTLMGVECAIVRDTVAVFEKDGEGDEGELVEDTFDYFAVDKDLNVWYFGEDTWEIEDGVIVNTNGRWLAGVDFAKPGILMHADPVVGSTYRQEFALDEAEDMGTLLAVGVQVEGPLGPFDGCRQTEDFTPLEPGVSEHKYYAPGIGLVREEDPENPDEGALELLEFFVRD